MKIKVYKNSTDFDEVDLDDFYVKKPTEFYFGGSYTEPTTGVTTIGRNLFVGTTVPPPSNLGKGATSESAGSYNTALGYSAQYALTTGSSNTALGYLAQRALTTGSSNTALGRLAQRALTTGYYNTALGYSAQYALTTGSYNTALGYSAGSYFGTESDTITKCNTSVYLGAYARAKADDTTNEIVIGYDAVGQGNNTVQLGNDSVTMGKIGSKTIATEDYVSGNYAPSSHTHEIEDIEYLADVLDNKAPRNHATGATTYGVGSFQHYGHCKVIPNLITPIFRVGEALAASQGYELDQKKIDKTS